MKNTAKKTTVKLYRLNLYNNYGMGEIIIFSNKKYECLNERRYTRPLHFHINGKPMEELTTFEVDKKDFQTFKKNVLDRKNQTIGQKDTVYWLELWERGEIIKTQYFY